MHDISIEIYSYHYFAKQIKLFTNIPQNRAMIMTMFTKGKQKGQPNSDNLVQSKQDIFSSANVSLQIVSLIFINPPNLLISSITFWIKSYENFSKLYLCLKSYG